MSSWERPQSGLTAFGWRVLYAGLDAERAKQLYPGEQEPGASYRRATAAFAESLVADHG